MHLQENKTGLSVAKHLVQLGAAIDSQGNKSVPVITSRSTANSNRSRVGRTLLQILRA
jgi:hypothetical protein